MDLPYPCILYVGCRKSLGIVFVVVVRWFILPYEHIYIQSAVSRATFKLDTSMLCLELEKEREYSERV